MEKRHLLERILSIFKRYGIRSITMDDLARELGISKKTLYYEFADKQDLISKSIDIDIVFNRRFFEEVNRTNLRAIQELFLLNERIHQDYASYSHAFYFDLKKYYPETYNIWRDEKRKNMFALILDNLQKGKREGVYRLDIHEQAIGNLYMMRMEMLNIYEFIDRPQLFSSEYKQEIFTYHLHGICNEHGLRILSGIKEKSANQKIKEI